MRHRRAPGDLRLARALGRRLPRPWLILTDRPPTQADVARSGLRAWIECGSKDLQHDGGRWEQTKMTDPRRAERAWLGLAPVTLGAVSTGSAGAAAVPPSARAAPSATPVSPGARPPANRRRAA